MAVEEVKKYLDQWGRGKDVREFTVSSATVDLAAQALGVDGARIAKTLAFKAPEAPADGALAALLVVCSGDARIDNVKFKNQFGLKAKMLGPDEVIAATGHAVGGVCPFALTNPLARVYLDESLKRFTTVFPACGSSNSVMETTCAELLTYSRAVGWVDVCKLPG